MQYWEIAILIHEQPRDTAKCTGGQAEQPQSNNGKTVECEKRADDDFDARMRRSFSGTPGVGRTAANTVMLTGSFLRARRRSVWLFRPRWRLIPQPAILVPSG